MNPEYSNYESNLPLEAATNKELRTKLLADLVRITTLSCIQSEFPSLAVLNEKHDIQLLKKLCDAAEFCLGVAVQKLVGHSETGFMEEQDIFKEYKFTISSLAVRLKNLSESYDGANDSIFTVLETLIAELETIAALPNGDFFNDDIQFEKLEKLDAANGFDTTQSLSTALALPDLEADKNPQAIFTAAKSVAELAEAAIEIFKKKKTIQLKKDEPKPKEKKAEVNALEAVIDAITMLPKIYVQKCYTSQKIEVVTKTAYQEFLQTVSRSTISNAIVHELSIAYSLQNQSAIDRLKSMIQNELDQIFIKPVHHILNFEVKALKNSPEAIYAVQIGTVMHQTICNKLKELGLQFEKTTVEVQKEYLSPHTLMVIAQNTTRCKDIEHHMALLEEQAEQICHKSVSKHMQGLCAKITQMATERFEHDEEIQLPEFWNTVYEIGREAICAMNLSATKKAYLLVAFNGLIMNRQNVFMQLAGSDEAAKDMYKSLPVGLRYPEDLEKSIQPSSSSNNDRANLGALEYSQLELPEEYLRDIYRMCLPSVVTLEEYFAFFAKNDKQEFANKVAQNAENAWNKTYKSNSNISNFKIIECVLTTLSHQEASSGHWAFRPQATLTLEDCFGEKMGPIISQAIINEFEARGLHFRAIANDMFGKTLQGSNERSIIKLHVKRSTIEDRLNALHTTISKKIPDNYVGSLDDIFAELHARVPDILLRKRGAIVRSNFLNEVYALAKKMITQLNAPPEVQSYLFSALASTILADHILLISTLPNTKAIQAAYNNLPAGLRFPEDLEAKNSNEDLSLESSQNSQMATLANLLSEIPTLPEVYLKRCYSDEISGVILDSNWRTFISSINVNEFADSVCNEVIEQYTNESAGKKHPSMRQFVREAVIDHINCATTSNTNWCFNLSQRFAPNNISESELLLNNLIHNQILKELERRGCRFNKIEGAIANNGYSKKTDEKLMVLQYLHLPEIEARISNILDGVLELAPKKFYKFFNHTLQSIFNKLRNLYYEQNENKKLTTIDFCIQIYKILEQILYEIPGSTEKKKYFLAAMSGQLLTELSRQFRAIAKNAEELHAMYKSLPAGLRFPDHFVQNCSEIPQVAKIDDEKTTHTMEDVLQKIESLNLHRKYEVPSVYIGSYDTMLKLLEDKVFKREVFAQINALQRKKDGGSYFDHQLEKVFASNHNLDIFVTLVSNDHLPLSKIDFGSILGRSLKIVLLKRGMLREVSNNSIGAKRNPLVSLVKDAVNSQSMRSKLIMHTTNKFDAALEQLDSDFSIDVQAIHGLDQQLNAYLEDKNDIPAIEVTNTIYTFYRDAIMSENCNLETKARVLAALISVALPNACHILKHAANSEEEFAKMYTALPPELRYPDPLRKKVKKKNGGISLSTVNIDDDEHSDASTDDQLLTHTEEERVLAKLEKYKQDKVFRAPANYFADFDKLQNLLSDTNVVDQLLEYTITEVKKTSDAIITRQKFMEYLTILMQPKLFCYLDLNPDSQKKSKIVDIKNIIHLGIKALLLKHGLLRRINQSAIGIRDLATELDIRLIHSEINSNTNRTVLLNDIIDNINSALERSIEDYPGGYKEVIDAMEPFLENEDDIPAATILVSVYNYYKQQTIAARIDDKIKVQVLSNLLGNIIPNICNFLKHAANNEEEFAKMYNELPPELRYPDPLKKKKKKSVIGQDDVVYQSSQPDETIELPMEEFMSPEFLQEWWEQSRGALRNGSFSFKNIPKGKDGYVKNSAEAALVPVNKAIATIIAQADSTKIFASKKHWHAFAHSLQDAVRLVPRTFMVQNSEFVYPQQAVQAHLGKCIDWLEAYFTEHLPNEAETEVDTISPDTVDTILTTHEDAPTIDSNTIIEPEVTIQVISEELQQAAFALLATERQKLANLTERLHGKLQVEIETVIARGDKVALDVLMSDIQEEHAFATNAIAALLNINSILNNDT